MGRGALMALAAAAPDRANAMVRRPGRRRHADPCRSRPDARRPAGRRRPGDAAVARDAAGRPGRRTGRRRARWARRRWSPCCTTKASTPRRSPGWSRRSGCRCPTPIRELHARWGMDRLDAGRHLSATPDELRRRRLLDGRDAAGGAPRGVAPPRHPRAHLGGRRHQPARGRHVERRGDPSARPARPDARDVRRRRLRDRGQPARCRSRQPPARPACPTWSPCRSGTGCHRPRRPRCSPRPVRHPTVVTHVVHRRCDGDDAATIEACRSVLDPDVDRTGPAQRDGRPRADSASIAGRPAGGRRRRVRGSCATPSASRPTLGGAGDLHRRRADRRARRRRRRT